MQMKMQMEIKNEIFVFGKVKLSVKGDVLKNYFKNFIKKYLNF